MPEPLLSRDPTASIETHLPDDRFVPIRTSELSAAISADAARFGADGATIGLVLRQLGEFLAREAATTERLLIEQYEAFNPDRDTILTPESRDARTPETREELLRQLSELFERANFERVNNGQLRMIAELAEIKGFRVRLDEALVEHLAIWVRGQSSTRRTIRTWRKPLRGEEIEVPCYRRFAFITQLADDPHILMKVFKDIPVPDMEALLPHASPEMTWWDRLTVVSGGAGAAGSAALRIISTLTAIIYWPRLLWIVSFGLGMAMYRTFMGYRRAKLQRTAQRTQHLYYQNLDNNSGVIHKLVASIAEEDLKESGLAYAMCHAANPPIASVQDLARRVEGYLSLRFCVQVEFDAEDAVRTLTRLGLWSDRERFQVVPPAWALAKLDAMASAPVAE